MDTWFGEDPVFDQEIEQQFGDDVEKACQGQLDHWAAEPHGRLALIEVQIDANILTPSATVDSLRAAAK